MDKKFLAEHQSRIQSEFAKYEKELIKNPLAIHPAISRFGNIKKPITIAESHNYPFDDEKIWSQIPFAGTLIIPLYSVPKEMSLNQHGFDSIDISDLVKIAKETQKIKFIFETEPLQYEGLDYLDPIIEEFEPPVVYSNTIFEKFSNKKDREKWNQEFFEIGSIKYFKELKYNVIKYGADENFVNALISGRNQTWNCMKILKMDDEIEKISNLMVDNPEEAEALFTGYIMKTAPIFDPITKNYNFSLSRLNKFKVNYDLKSGIHLPELGKLALNKLVLNPGSYYGCINAIQKYEDNDLYKLLNSFEKAVVAKNDAKLIESKNQLEDIFENVWNDVKKSVNQVKGVKSGLSIAFGIGGTYGTTAIQGASSSDPGLAAASAFVGLLAGLGYNTFESHFNIKSTFSERITSFFKPNYMVNILDFTKKYEIN